MKPAALYNWLEETEPQENQEVMSFLKIHRNNHCYSDLKYLDTQATFKNVIALYDNIKPSAFSLKKYIFNLTLFKPKNSQKDVSNDRYTIQNKDKQCCVTFWLSNVSVTCP